MEESLRKQVLEEAEKCVCHNRNDEYGEPEDVFGIIAFLWTGYTGTHITAEDVANMMILLKVSRAKNKFKLDNYIDIAGYAACAAECNKSED